MDFIEHDPGTCRPPADQCLKPMRVARKLEKKRGIEQVESEGIGKHLLKPGTLSCPSGAKQEEGSLRPLEQPGHDIVLGHLHSAYRDVRLQCIFTSCS